MTVEVKGLMFLSPVWALGSESEDLLLQSCSGDALENTKTKLSVIKSVVSCCSGTGVVYVKNNY